MDESVTATAIAAGGVVVVEEPTTDPRTAAASATEKPGSIGQTMAAPLFTSRGPIGVLVASRRPGGDPYDQVDREVIEAIAAQAALALELAEVRQDNEILRRAEDRAEIADRLRQQVIERLFQHALALQGLAARSGDPARAGLQRQVDEVDEIIKDIRSAVLEFDSEPGRS
jgi:GAF domain-containing protein